MTNRTPQSILSLPAEMKSPEAYRVLGLVVFEADRVKIKAAADATLARLKDAKTSSDNAAWETAAQWTKNAYAILSDASKKAAYDRKLAAEIAGKPPVIDPLADVLPVPAASRASIQPAFHPGHAARITSPTIDPLGVIPPTPVPAGYAIPTDNPLAALTSSIDAAIPVVKNRSSVNRRRGLPWVPIFLSLFCLLTIAGLAGIVYVMQRGSAIVINTTGGPLIGSAVDADGDGQMVRPPGNVPQRNKRPYDPVMGGLAGDMPPPQAPEIVDETGQVTAAVEQPAVPMPAMAELAMTAPEVTTSITPNPIVPIAETTTPAPVPEPTPNPEPTPEQLQAGDAAIIAVTTAIKKHDWAKLKSLAEKAESMAANDLQKEQASMLFQLVDLATFYRGGIVKAIGELQAGNELDLRDDLKVGIVETGADKLIIRHNGKNKAYTFDTLPLSLAHKLARLSLTVDSPTNQAAMYAFQAIAPITTADYREAAIKELNKINDEIEGAEPAKLVAAIRFVYPQ